MILAVGTDLVPVDRLARSLERSPSLLTRLFSSRELALLGFDAERQLPGQLTSTRAASLAARFAAKEAVLKALGTLEARAGVAGEAERAQVIEHAQHWLYAEIEVLSRAGTPPRLELSSETATYAAQLAKANVETNVETAGVVESVGHFNAPAGERPRSEMPPETGDLTELDRAWDVREASHSASRMSWHLSLAHDGGMALAFVILELSTQAGSFTLH